MKNKIIPAEMNWDKGKVEGFLGKEFISLTNGGLKLIKVEPLAQYPEHIHPDKTEFAYVLEGIPEFVINSEAYLGKVGDVFIFPFNTKHAIKNSTSTPCLLLIGSIRN